MIQLPALTIPQDKFGKLAMIALTGLALGVVVLAFLNTSTNLHVRSVELNGSSAAAEMVNQRLVIRFNRPLLKDTVDAAISISPQVKYILSWQGNDLIVTFNQNLQSDTAYVFSISSEAQDVYKSNLPAGFIYQFRTKPLKLFYLENAPAGEVSRIIRTQPGLTDAEEIYAAEGISKFDVSRQYVAAVISIPSQLENHLILKHLQTGTERKLTFKNARVTKVRFSPTSNEMAVVVQNLREVQGMLIPDAGSKIRIYNLDSLQYSELNPQGIANEVIDVIYSPNGQMLLFKISDSNYYLTDLRDPENIVILGKHLGASGFNRQSDTILFVDFDPLNTYSSLPYFGLFKADKSTIKLNSNTSYVVDPQFFHNEDSLIYAEKFQELEGTKGMFKLMLGDFNGKSLTLYTDPQHSLELPRLSVDDRYIVAERYTPVAMTDYSTQRDFQFQTKPAQANLLVIDLMTGVITDTGTQGIDAVWQP